MYGRYLGRLAATDRSLPRLAARCAEKLCFSANSPKRLAAPPQAGGRAAEYKYAARKSIAFPHTEGRSPKSPGSQVLLGETPGHLKHLSPLAGNAGHFGEDILIGLARFLEDLVAVVRSVEQVKGRLFPEFLYDRLKEIELC